MKCPECHIENRQGVKFCEECGHKMDIRCPSCGAFIPMDKKFCGECGQKIAADDAFAAYAEPAAYTPKFITDKILTTRSAVQGERKVVTVLFADVADYTGLSEKLDPEEVHHIMDGAFKILMDAIHKYDGTINQFTGDGVMALFGAPIAHEDHAKRACFASLAIQKSMEEYGEKIQKDYDVPFVMRIGLNSGLVIVGAIGDDLRMDYTAIGDTANLAARMETMARPGTVLISHNTYKLVREYFSFNPIGKVQVKGKEELQEAYEVIKPGNIETRIHASAIKGLTRFVGRKNSMATLKDAFQKAQSGSGQVVGIVGEAGVGKSRLILEMQHTMGPAEYTWLEGRCLHFGGLMAYLPIRDILRSYFNIIDGDREYIIKKKIKDTIFELDNALSNVIPPFQDLLSVTVDDDDFRKLEPQHKRERIFEALRDLFIRESQRRPLILIFEDLHWVDNTTQEFVDYLINWLGTSRIMLIILNRPEYIHQWSSKTCFTKIGLDQLGAASSIELIQALFEGAEMVPELKELILKKAAGNPLFMEEFTHTLLENGTIQIENNTYVLSGNIQDIQVPDTIQGIIAARMDRLEDNLKQTMQVASVIGRDFAFRILQVITNMRDDLKACLLNLQGLEFIYEKNLFPELEYIFKHALIQEVAYNSLLLSRRKEIHENIGTAIEEIYANRIEEFYEMLAHHYSKSGNHEKACLYFKLSGVKAVQNYANQEAHDFFMQALDELRCLPDTNENQKTQLKVLLLVSNPMTSLGYPEGSLEIFEKAVALSELLGYKRRFVIANSVISIYYSCCGDLLQGQKYAEEGFYEARKMQDIELMAPLVVSLTMSYQIAGNFYKVIDIAPDTIDLLEKTSRETDNFGYPYNLYSYLLSSYGLSMGATGNFRQGKQFIEKGLDFAIKINDLYAMGHCEMNYGYFCEFKCDGRNMIAHIQNAIKYFEEINNLMMLSWCWGFLGYGYYLLGDFTSAEMHIEKSLSMQSQVQTTWALEYQDLYLSYIHHDRGELIKAQTCAEKATRSSIEKNTKLIEGWSKLSLGRILGKKESSNMVKAEEFILQGIAILEGLKNKPFIASGVFLLGELYANTGRKDEALEKLKTAQTMCEVMELGFWPEKIQEVLDRLMDTI